MKQTVTEKMHYSILRTIEVWENNKWRECDFPECGFVGTVGSYADWLLTYEQSNIIATLNNYKAIRLNGQYIIRRDKEVD